MMPKSERLTRLYLIARGYYVVRAAGSRGPWDIIASCGSELLFIQCKANQLPRKDEMERLLSFNNYPKLSCIKHQIWIWKSGNHEPIITNVR